MVVQRIPTPLAGVRFFMVPLGHAIASVWFNPLVRNGGRVNITPGKLGGREFESRQAARLVAQLVERLASTGRYVDFRHMM